MDFCSHTEIGEGQDFLYSQCSSFSHESNFSVTSYVYTSTLSEELMPGSLERQLINI